MTETPRPGRVVGLILFLLTLVLAGVARPSEVSAGETTLRKDRDSVTIRSQADYLRDDTGALTVADVTKPAFAARFAPRPGGLSPFGVSKSVYWVRVTLRNAGVGRTNWNLVIEAPTLDEVHAFIPDATGSFAEKIAGDTVPASKHDVRNRNMVFPVAIPDGATRTVYLRVSAAWPDRLPMTAMTATRLESWDRTTGILFGIIYGIMLMLALHNLFLCVSEGDASQILFAAFAVSLVLAEGFVNGLVFEVLWPELPFAVNVGATMSINAATIAGILFTGSLLNTREIPGPLHRLLIYLLIGAGLLILVSLIDHTVAAPLSTAVAVLALLAGLLAGILAWRQGVRYARYFVSGLAILLGGSLIFTLAAMGLLPEPLSSVLTVQFAGAAAIVLLSMSVGERVKVRRENRIADLLESEERYALAIVSGGVEVWDWNIDDGTVRVSEALATSLGLTMPGQSPVIKPKQFLSAIEASDRRRYLRAMKRHYDGATEAFECQYRIVDRDGKVQWINDRGFAWRDQTGRAYRMTGALRDISTVKIEEEALRRAMDEAQFASRMKSEFLAKMSHELRTPLNAIIGFSQMMVAESLGPMGNEKYLDYAKDIGASGSHLLDLINDILDLSKVEAGKLDLNERVVDVRDVILSSMQFVQGRARSARVGLSTVFGDPLHDVYADQRSLKQIIINLLTNAIKFTPSGGRVTIKAVMDHHNALILTVTDTGVGIAADEVQRMMQPFSRIDGGGQGEQEGTGLGLWLTKALVELHGGTMDLKSEDGAGTMVVVRFPADRTIIDDRKEPRRADAPADGLYEPARGEIKGRSQSKPVTKRSSRSPSKALSKSGAERRARSRSRAGGPRLSAAEPANVTEIARRIRAMWLRLGAKAAIDLGLSVEEADAMSKAISGERTGLFAAIDQLGVDQLPQVAGALPVSHGGESDSAVDRVPQLIQRMIAAGYTGHKGKGGFYRVTERAGAWVKEAIDLKTGLYRSLAPVRLESLSAGNHDLRALVTHTDRSGQFAWLLVSHTLSYAAVLVPDTGPNVEGVDEVMKLEAGWRWGPFELIDKIGASWFARRLRSERRPVPRLLDLVGDGDFYDVEVEVEGPEGQDGAYDTVSPHIFGVTKN